MRWRVSARLRAEARTRTRMSSGPGSGMGTRPNPITSGPPKPLSTIAFIVSPLISCSLVGCLPPVIVYRILRISVSSRLWIRFSILRASSVFILSGSGWFYQAKARSANQKRATTRITADVTCITRTCSLNRAISSSRG